MQKQGFVPKVRVTDRLRSQLRRSRSSRSRGGRYLLAILSVIVFGAPLLLRAEPQSIGGPILGFIPDAGGTAVRRVIGIPGASALGERLELGLDIRGATISPRQDFAIASPGADGQTVVIDIAAEPPVVTPVAGAHPGAEL